MKAKEDMQAVDGRAGPNEQNRGQKRNAPSLDMESIAGLRSMISKSVWAAARPEMIAGMLGAACATMRRHEVSTGTSGEQGADTSRRGRQRASGQQRGDVQQQAAGRAQPATTQEAGENTSRGNKCGRTCPTAMAPSITAKKTATTSPPVYSPASISVAPYHSARPAEIIAQLR